MDQVDSDATEERNTKPNLPIIPTLSTVHAQEKQNADPGDTPSTKGTSPDSAKFGYWKQLIREKPDRHIELFLTLVIGFFAAVQLVVSWRNNDSTTQQTNQLIRAAEISAVAANHNAQAARDFSNSARSINEGIGDAVDRLSAQAKATQDAADAASQSSITAKEALHISQRAYLVAGQTHFDDVTLGLLSVPIANGGHLPSRDIFGTLEVITFEVPVPQRGNYIAAIIDARREPVHIASIASAGAPIVIHVLAPKLSQDKFRNGTQTVKGYGILHYNDGFDDTPLRELPICFDSKFDLDTKGTVFDPCDPEEMRAKYLTVRLTSP